MTGTSEAEADQFKQLYDVERHVMKTDGGILVEDPYPQFAELREAAPVHEGTMQELLGLPPAGLSARADAPHFAPSRSRRTTSSSATTRRSRRSTTRASSP